jgi:hypothetical protein
VREDGDTAQGNLLVNRAAALLDVDSWLPYEGRVVVHNKGARASRCGSPAGLSEGACAQTCRAGRCAWNG